MNRCKQCNAPLTINGTHCNRCNAPRDDIGEQNRKRQKRGPFVTFLCWVLGTFFSLTFLLWFAACAGVGAAAGCAGFYLFSLSETICWIIAVVVTLLIYGLTWLIFIFHN